MIVGGSKLNDMGAVISALSDGGLSVVRARTALFDAPLISTVSQQPGKARSGSSWAPWPSKNGLPFSGSRGSHS